MATGTGSPIRETAMKFRHQILFGLPVVMLVCGVLSVPVEAQFTQQGPKLVGTGAVGPAEQGRSVSLSGDGNTAIVGGSADNNSTGAAWVFTRSGGVWNQQAKLVGTGAEGQAAQGISVSLSGDGNTAIVGGWADNNPIGAAWVFTRSNGVWSQEQKLVGAGVLGPVASQGFSVSLSGYGTTAIVGGPGDGPHGGPTGDGSGAAWVYTRSGGVWTQQGPKLVGTGAERVGANLGYSVSLTADGNTAIVGAPQDPGAVGAAWVFTRSGGVWSQQGPKLVGTDAVGAQSQGFSVSLSGAGNTAIVGGPFGASAGGAAWVYTRSDGMWTQQTKLVGAGWSVSLSGDGNTAMVGEPGDGAAVYTRSGGVWSQQGPKLVGSGAVGLAFQGTSVSLSGDGNTAIVGGPNDNSNIGAAWVFAQPVFAGTPGKANCHGQSVSALARQYGGLNGAAAALGFADVSALQNDMMGFCGG